MKAKKVSIYRLSKLTGLPWSTIANYKNGSEMSFKNACKIADALEISLDTLRKEVKTTDSKYSNFNISEKG